MKRKLIFASADGGPIIVGADGYMNPFQVARLRMIVDPTGASMHLGYHPDGKVKRRMPFPGAEE